MLKGLNTKEANLNEDQIKELVSGQLRFLNKDFEEATKNMNWRNENQLSYNEYSEWLNWAIDLLTSKYYMEEREAQIQLSWMELKWGLKVNYEN